MKLIFIYGAPATGKLTAGKKLSELTGFKLYHNHLTIDPVLTIFSFDQPEFLRLCGLINLDVLTSASEAKLPGLIFTYTYGGLLDDPFIEEVIRRFDSEVQFVHLVCDVEELKRRAANADRRVHHKVVDPEILTLAMKAIDYDKDIDHRCHLTVDTTRLPPLETAREIVTRGALPVRTDG
jgi:hypothetical protein